MIDERMEREEEESEEDESERVGRERRCCLTEELCCCTEAAQPRVVVMVVVVVIGHCFTIRSRYFGCNPKENLLSNLLFPLLRLHSLHQTVVRIGLLCVSRMCISANFGDEFSSSAPESPFADLY